MLYFLGAQQDFIMPQGWLWHGMRYHAYELFLPPPPWKVEDGFFWIEGTVLPWLSLLLLVVTTVWLVRKKESLLAVTVVTVALFSRNQAFWRSVLRYDLPLIPLMSVPWLAWAAKTRAEWQRPLKIGAALVFGILVALGFTLQWFLAVRMHAGAWTF